MYLLDANILIEAKNRYYGFDLAPGFWDWIEKSSSQGATASIEPVHTELVAGNDELANWARNNTAFFAPIDQAATAHFAPLIQWANSRNYTSGALARFSSNDADFLLIAYAKAHGYTVVTHERPQPEARKRVLIPDACHAIGVKTIDTFAMLRATGAQLILA